MLFLHARPNIIRKGCILAKIASKKNEMVPTSEHLQHLLRKLQEDHTDQLYSAYSSQPFMRDPRRAIVNPYS